MAVAGISEGIDDLGDGPLTFHNVCNINVGLHIATSMHPAGTCGKSFNGLTAMGVGRVHDVR